MTLIEIPSVLNETHNNQAPPYIHEVDYSLSRIESLEKTAYLLGIQISIEILAKQQEQYIVERKTPDGNNLIKETKVVALGQTRVRLKVFGNHRLLFFAMDILAKYLDKSGNFNEELFWQEINNWVSEDKNKSH
ncbi:MAG: hypothetical protein NZM26_00900 [Patescibacteria group bacterium]|nr:hypothetical protein [Patescibacteria group bacterium]